MLVFEIRTKPFADLGESVEKGRWGREEQAGVPSLLPPSPAFPNCDR